MSTQEYVVEVQPDFLERLAKAPPIHAVAELIWNGLDADATVVSVDFEYDGLGGMSKIVQADTTYPVSGAETHRPLAIPASAASECDAPRTHPRLRAMFARQPGLRHRCRHPESLPSPRTTFGVTAILPMGHRQSP